MSFEQGKKCYLCNVHFLPQRDLPKPYFLLATNGLPMWLPMGYRWATIRLPSRRSFLLVVDPPGSVAGSSTLGPLGTAFACVQVHCSHAKTFCPDAAVCLLLCQLCLPGGSCMVRTVQLGRRTGQMGLGTVLRNVSPYVHWAFFAFPGMVYITFSDMRGRRLCDASKLSCISREVHAFQLHPCSTPLFLMYWL